MLKYIYLTLSLCLKFDAYFLLYGIISPFLTINSEQGLCSPDMIFGLVNHGFKGKDRRICLPPRQRCHDSPTKHIPLWVTAMACYALRALCGIIASHSSLKQSDPFRILSCGSGGRERVPVSHAHVSKFTDLSSKKKCTHAERPLETAKTPLPSCSSGGSIQWYECFGKIQG